VGVHLAAEGFDVEGLHGFRLRGVPPPECCLKIR
jgi:hypothetical protein